jgi:signal transduction histidine kinase
MAETLPVANPDSSEALQTTTLVELATRATTRLETHVRNITMLGENMDVKIAPMNLRDAAEAAKRNLSRLWEFRDQVERVELQIPSNLPPVLGDKNGISTVLQLLLDNAIKFSEREVLLKAQVSKGTGVKTVEVCVQDFGIGIASGEIDKIFDTFYQVDGSETRHYGGAGVGLALVRIILVKHGIEIRVESEIGIGSRFCFCMPIMPHG